MEDLPKGAFICEYVGEVVTNTELDEINRKGRKPNVEGRVSYASLFGVGALEALVVIGVVALLVFGPKGLAEVARNLRKTLRAFQPTIRELQEFKSPLEREIGLDDDPRSMRNPYQPATPPKPTPVEDFQNVRQWLFFQTSEQIATAYAELRNANSNAKAAQQIGANPVFHERTKHLRLDCHYIRERIAEGLIQTKHIGTAHQIADIMTKALGEHQHAYLSSKLGLVMSPPSQGGYWRSNSNTLSITMSASTVD